MLLLLPLLLLSVNATFSPSFDAFLRNSYGAAVADRLARVDIGPHGSYGGGSHVAGTRTSRQAAVLVHGITNTAGTFDGWRRHFHGVGWGDETVYATTYGDGGKTAAPLVDMKCDYVKQMNNTGIDFDFVMKQMSGTYDLQASKAKEEELLRKAGMGKDVPAAKEDWNRHMSVKLGQDRSGNVGYCQCTKCHVLPYKTAERENYCCRDLLMKRKTSWNENLSGITDGHGLQCITEWTSFRKIVLDKEVLFSHLKYAAVKNKEPRMKLADLDNKNLRYLACNVYTSLVHGENLGYGVRLELPNCVRWSIINEFPEKSGLYSRFEAVSGEEHTLTDFERNANYMNEYCDKCDARVERVHRFPKNPERIDEWLKGLQWDGKSKNMKMLPNLFICSRHFTKESYKNDQRDQSLIKGATPTISKPMVPSSAMDIDQYSPSKCIDSDVVVDMEVDEVVPLLTKDCSQQSHRTDISWKSNATFRSNAEVFLDVETKQARLIRKTAESNSMASTGLNYSLLAHSALLELLDFIPGCLKCKNNSAIRTFKTVRMMIQSVAAFTRRRVDVVGYSMGSPIARKAILGGACMDTGEYLGPTITGLIDTFVSVAGANRGSLLCLFPFPGACNMVNGLSCHQRYEGLHIYSIYSPGDDKVGHKNGCGEVTSSIVGADAEFVKSGNHDEVMVKSAQLQINLVDKHAALGQ